MQRFLSWNAIFSLALYGWLLSPMGAGADDHQGVVTPPHVEAPQVFLMDPETQTVLWHKNADQQMGPSSMTKIMTAYMVFEKLHKGLVSLQDKLPVSEKAWRMQGSKMFVELGSAISIEDLLHGVIIVSGNDACVVLSEGLWGSEDVLAQSMTEKAKTLGATCTVFKNSTGWPHPEHLSTAQDLAHIAARLIQDFPTYYRFFSKKEWTYNGIHQMNRNPLLYTDLQADGIKTGQTDAAGFGLVGSAVHNGFRVILVMNGLKSAAQRAHEAELLMRWAFREFESPTLLQKDHPLEEVSVWLGSEDSVPVVVTQDVKLTLPRGLMGQSQLEMVYKGPVEAPIYAGQHVADLYIHVPHQPDRVVPLVAQKAVGAASFWRKIPATLRYLVFGHSHRQTPSE